MVLFDSLLAFALTLAALATVVTLLLEFAIRVCGVKRKGQVELFKKLLETETVKGLLPDAAASRWDVVKNILQNPFAAKGMASTEGEQGYRGTAAQGIYREVSLEHVLRRLLETDAAKGLIADTKEELEPKLHKIARKYDELSSALGAEFKRHAQWWSIAVGIALAVVMNADGARLLQTYLQDNDLRNAVIEKVSLPETPGDAAGGGTSGGGTSGGDVSGDGASDRTPQDALEDLSRQLALINELALPLGNGYFPHCLALSEEEREASADPLCRPKGPSAGFSTWLSWILKVGLTGVLIGLGAPFWYDVARRLAAVRSAFQGTPSSEERHRGADGATDQEARDDLIERIAKDAATGTAKRTGGNGGAAPAPGGSPA
ncbi:hypothetical protein AAFN88_02000 [Pelagibius sp. CAU 1746]|uniref:hypothetical protein n=1 Tax=Pelagibius sp. CAU 1746 TaxID=3140370 RepID=UPI00325B8527